MNNGKEDKKNLDSPAQSTYILADSCSCSQNEEKLEALLVCSSFKRVFTIAFRKIS